MLSLYATLFFALSYIAWRAFLYKSDELKISLRERFDPYARFILLKIEKLLLFVASYESASIFSKWFNLILLSIFAFFAFVFAKITKLFKLISKKLAHQHARHARFTNMSKSYQPKSDDMESEQD